MPTLLSAFAATFVMLVAQTGGVGGVGGDGDARAAKATEVSVPVDATIRALLTSQDTDGDGLITVADHGDRRFGLEAAAAGRFEVEGTAALGNLLQELGAAQHEGRAEVRLTRDEVFEPAAAHVSRMIREHYWDWLTRTVDAAGLARIAEDPKLAGRPSRVYVPGDDAGALAYYKGLAAEHPEMHLQVVGLPREITPEYVRSLNDVPGILALALRPAPDATGKVAGVRGEPFVVPGGRFNEMYGWDSYFISLGLLKDGRVELAKAMVDNFVYQIEHYGKILNANRTYYLTRSQPPFLTSMVLGVWDKLPREGAEGEANKAWLRRAMAAAANEYSNVWTSQPHLTTRGLSRYFGAGLGLPPEVEPGHFDPILKPLAAKAGLSVEAFAKGYSEGTVASPELDAFLKHDRAMRESGHDTCYRLLGRAADLNPVSLNALLYKYEIDLADTIEHELRGELKLADGSITTPETWRHRAENRRDTMMKLMWDEKQALFFDYDFVHQQRLTDVSPTTLYPLWAGMMTPEQGKRLAAAALAQLEAPGGVVAGTEASRGRLGENRPARQWDYPFGWAPHQMIAWEAMRRAGLEADAQRLAYRWTWMLASEAARHNGAIVEKYDVVARSLETSAEYGNVGARFRLVPQGGFGWTNASFEVGLSVLTPEQRRDLDLLVPPEWLFGQSPLAQPGARVPGGE